jgi:hypothetical protein
MQLGALPRTGHRGRHRTGRAAGETERSAAPVLLCWTAGRSAQADLVPSLPSLDSSLSITLNSQLRSSFTPSLLPHLPTPRALLCPSLTQTHCHAHSTRVPPPLLAHLPYIYTLWWTTLSRSFIQQPKCPCYPHWISKLASQWRATAEAEARASKQWLRRLLLLVLLAASAAAAAASRGAPPSSCRRCCCWRRWPPPPATRSLPRGTTRAPGSGRCRSTGRTPTSGARSTRRSPATIPPSPSGSTRPAVCCCVVVIFTDI